MGKEIDLSRKTITEDKDGNALITGKVSTEGAIVDAKDLTTKEYVDNAIAQASIGGEVDTSGFALKSDIGDKANLKTNDKSSIVNSINEMAESYATAEYVDVNIEMEVGKRTDLATDNKNTIVASINEVHNKLELKADKSEVETRCNSIANATNNVAAGLTTVANLVDSKANSADLSAVATSGSYNDLTDKPVIPSVQGLASESYVNQQISKIQHPTYDDTAIKNQLANKADKSDLFSGDYNDLTNKPEIPNIEGLASEAYVNNKLANLQLVKITQAEYDALEIKDPNTLYLIVE